MNGRAPGAYIEFVEASPAIQPTRVDVAALVCVTERGPVDVPVRVGSWRHFAATFGEFVANGLGAYAAKAYFDGGGGPAWVVRVAAPARETVTTGVQPPGRLTSVVVTTDGLTLGAVATLSQPGCVHRYLVTAVDAASATISWDRRLHEDFDLTQPITVASGAAAASGELLDAAGVPALRLSAASPGAWGDQLEVVSGPGRRVATATRPGQASGPVVTAVQDASGFTVGDHCRLLQQVGGVAVQARAQVASVDAARRQLTWTAALPGTVDRTRAFTIESVTFDLVVLRRGAAVEAWADLSVVPEHPRSVASVLASSAYLRATVVGTEQPAPARLRLAGGRDGTAGLSIEDLVGDEVLGNGRGAAALVDIEEPAVLCLPDLVAAPHPPLSTDPVHADPCDPCASGSEAVPGPTDPLLVEAPASFGDEQVVAAQQLLIDSCERNTERIVLLDPPHTAEALADLRAWAGRFSSSYAVTVAPWVSVVEPTDSRTVRLIPASGHLAGLIARCDAERGPWLSPANRTLPWAHGLRLHLDADAHAVANDAAINLIRSLPGRGLVPLGSRTLSADAAWRFVAVRRTMIFLRRALRHYLAWTVFEPHDAALEALVTQAIAGLLTDVWEAGGLAGSSIDEAFVVVADPAGTASGELRLLVGVALSRPAEFVIARVWRTGNTLEIAEEPTLVTAGGAR